MKKNIVFLIILVLMISGCSNTAKDISVPEIKTYNSQYFKVEQLADGVFAAIVPEDENCNAGIVDLGDCVLVIDTFISSESAAELKKAAEALTGKKVRYVVNTHPHEDHIAGNEVFADDATIICTGVVSKYLKLPQGKGSVETFENERIIKGSMRSVRVIEVGPAHSESDSIVYLPEDKIVFMADLKYVLNMGPPSMLESAIENMIKINGGDSFNGVVWGHGPGTKDDIKLLSQFFVWAKSAVKEALDNKATAKQVENTPLPDQFTWDKEVVRMYKGYLRFLYYTMQRENK